MSETEKYIILKLDEASADDPDRETVWIQQAEVESDADFTYASKVLNRWLDEQTHPTVAGTYLVGEIGRSRLERFTVTPRVEFDVERESDRDEVAA